MSKSQSSLEIAIIFGIMLLVFTIFLVLNTEMSAMITSRHSRSSISVALDDIAFTAQHVFIQGQGASSQVFISLPGNVIGSFIENNTIEIHQLGRNAPYVSYRILPFNITGTLPNSSGNYWITVESFGGFVNVS